MVEARQVPWSGPLTGQPALDRLATDVEQLRQNLVEHGLPEEGASVKSFMLETMVGNVISRLHGSLLTDKHANHLDLSDLADCGWHSVVRVAQQGQAVDVSFAFDPHQDNADLDTRFTALADGSDDLEAAVQVVLDEAEAFARQRLGII